MADRLDKVREAAEHVARAIKILGDSYGKGRAEVESNARCACFHAKYALDAALDAPAPTDKVLEAFEAWWEKAPRPWGYDMSVAWQAWQASRAALAAPSGGDATPRDEAVALLADARKCVVLANANGYYDVWLSRCDRVLGGAR